MPAGGAPRRTSPAFWLERCRNIHGTASIAAAGIGRDHQVQRGDGLGAGGERHGPGGKRSGASRAAPPRS